MKGTWSVLEKSISEWVALVSDTLRFVHLDILDSARALKPRSRTATMHCP